MTILITLTDEELMLLDGKVRSDLQAIIDLARVRLETKAALVGVPDNHATFIARAVEEAQTNGKLISQYCSLSRCAVCRKRGSYVAYKSGPRKGEWNYAKPIYLAGVELAERGVSAQGLAAVGCCRDCYAALLPALKNALANVKAELPAELAGKTRYTWHHLNECSACGWKGHDGEMIPLPAVMGGEYPGECPNCHKKNLPFGPTIIKWAKGFVVVKRGTETYQCRVPRW